MGRGRGQLLLESGLIAYAKVHFFLYLKWESSFDKKKESIWLIFLPNLELEGTDGLAWNNYITTNAHGKKFLPKLNYVDLIGEYV